MDNIESRLNDLVRRAILSGASKAAIISADTISAEDDLANLCREPQCRNYGLSPSCPPHVSGPSGFKKLLQNIKHAIVVRIEMPSAILFSDERRDILKLLHEIVASVEQAAIKTGFTDSKAFAGSSCKKIFCHEHTACRVIANNAHCRNPQSARPSMSGYGINVSKLMQAAGWPSDINMRQKEAKEESMSWVAGLILIG